MEGKGGLYVIVYMYFRIEGICISENYNYNFT